MMLPTIALIASLTAASALQFCQVDPVHLVDLCLAATAAVNSTTGRNDLSIHLSANFPERNGWVAVGLGEEMDGALMFIMAPGVEAGDVMVSVRTIDSWAAPVEFSNTTSTLSILVTRTWFESVSGLHHAQILCYNCESWSTSRIALNDSSQPWIWSSNPHQVTQSADTKLPLLKHRSKGLQFLNMASAFTTTGDLVAAQVSGARISSPLEAVSESPIVNDRPDGQPETKLGSSPASKTHHHSHKLFNATSLHGILLALSFLALSIGTLGIRSGLVKSFKLHWIVQAIGGTGIIVGCLLGIWLSYAHGGHFNTFHQWIGLSILPTIVLQALFGYWHHVNFVRYRSRTAVSNYHVWIGRILLVLGNVNVCFGLNLTHPFIIERIVYYIVIFMQALPLVFMWYFWLREGRTISDVVNGKETDAADSSRNVKYVNIEPGESDSFIVGGVGDEYELGEEEELGVKKIDEETGAEEAYRTEKH